MNTNLNKYKDDLDKLISTGDDLLSSLFLAYDEENEHNKISVKEKNKASEGASIFREKYETWYTESIYLIKQILPDRLNDFLSLYKIPSSDPKKIDSYTYTISDFVLALEIKKGGKIIVGKVQDVITKFSQQLNILKSVHRRFDSSLFDIKQLLNADIFDNELDSANELLLQGFTRAAGAVCGVVLEKHLKEVLINHNIDIADKFKNKKPCINDLNTLLKGEGIIDIPTWRKIQWLGDIRNQCDHAGSLEPKNEDVKDLIEGVKKVTKTIF